MGVPPDTATQYARLGLAVTSGLLLDLPPAGHSITAAQEARLLDPTV